MTISNLGCHVQAFFADYLAVQRGLSPHTIASYRDAIKLLLVFAARHQRKTVAALTLDDLGPDVVLAFLDDLEKSRGNSIRTRNARLAAIHSLFGYVAAHDPELLGVCQRIGAIPVKKTKTPTVVYLEHEEVLHLLASIDRSTSMSRRDYLIILFLFETGARAQEIASVSTSSLHLSEAAQVQILGKGRKQRICPLRKKTASLIRDHLKERDVTSQDEPLFLGCRGKPLTRIGILRVVQRRVRSALDTMPSLAAKRIGAHTFRHTAAIHLLRRQRPIRHPKLAWAREHHDHRSLHRRGHRDETPSARGERRRSIARAPPILEERP